MGKFGDRLRSNQEKQETRVARALDGNPEKMMGNPETTNVSCDMSHDDAEVNTRINTDGHGVGESKPTNGVTEQQEGKDLSPLTPNPSPLTSQPSPLTPSTQVMSGKDLLGEEYMQFAKGADFKYSKGINVTMPASVNEKLITIKEELGKTDNANLRLSKQQLVQFFIYREVEKWYTAVTGKKV